MLLPAKFGMFFCQIIGLQFGKCFGQIIDLEETAVLGGIAIVFD